METSTASLWFPKKKKKTKQSTEWWMMEHGKREKSAELGSSRIKNMQCCVIAECPFWRKRLNGFAERAADGYNQAPR